MTTATKTLPKHGTQYRYRGPRNGSWPPCHCDTCTRAHSRACALRAIAHLAGQPPLYPGEPLREHVATLMAAGMSQSLIARRARISQATISYLAHGLTQSVQRDKALRILAVTAGDFDAIAECPVAGTIRRVRALYAERHGAAAIAAVTGLNQATVSNIANGHYHVVSGATRSVIADAYACLASQPGTSGKAQHRARTQGWHDRAFWDDVERIDDADFDPDVKQLRVDQIAEDARWLIAGGLDRSQAADRLGVSRFYVDKALREVPERVAA